MSLITCAHAAEAVTTAVCATVHGKFRSADAFRECCGDKISAPQPRTAQWSIAVRSVAVQLSKLLLRFGHTIALTLFVLTAQITST